MTGLGKVVQIDRNGDFESFVDASEKCLVLVHFWADWSESCSQMNEVLDELANSVEIRNFKFIKVEAEKFPEISKRYKVQAVPTFIFLKGSTVIDRFDGASPSELTKKVYEHSKAFDSYASEAVADTTHEDLNTRLKKLVNSAPCMVFLKGSPGAPRCGFSKTLMQILDETGVSYKTFDILEDEEVRQGLKTYSNWPTYPQVYVDGELIGGLDIIRELKETNELVSALKIKI